MSKCATCQEVTDPGDRSSAVLKGCLKLTAGLPVDLGSIGMHAWMDKCATSCSVGTGSVPNLMERWMCMPASCS